ncbi:MAG TPA: hypothetical protein VHI71_00245 [Actinomycetota bacterium]|nr:hypothetical protein [Actinomycetota bacterium]
MNRGPVELRPVRRLDPLRHRRSPGGFKTVWLNAAGWGALVGPGLVLGFAATLSGAPLAIALPAGVLVAWAVALVLDHLRWRNQLTAMGTTGLDATTGPIVVARLRELGIEAGYREIVVDDLDDGTPDVQRSIVCRNADRDTAERVMRDVLAP